MIEGQRLDPPLRIGDGHDRIAGTEIDADGKIMGIAHSSLERIGRGPDGLYAKAPRAKRNRRVSAFPSGTATLALWRGR
jgi:hypothetical protein